MNDRDRTPHVYTAIVSLGGLVFGFDASVISGVVGFIVPEFGLNDWQLGLVVSAPTLAAMLAALCASLIADAMGRKKVLLALAALYSASALLSATASSFEVLLAARFLGGLAFSSLIVAPMYIGEIAPPDRRGFLVSVNQMNIVIGFSLAYFANYFILQASQSTAPWVQAAGVDRFAWRWMLGIEAVPALAWLVMLTLAPESPRWLVIRGRIEDARRVLDRLRPASEVGAELAAIRDSVSGKALDHRFNIRKLFKANMRLPLTIGLVVGIAQQVTGINAIFFYAPTIFEQSGVGTNAAFAQATLIGIVNVVFTVIAMLAIDRLGRKPLLVIGLAGIILSLSLAGLGFKQATYQLTPEAMAHLPMEIDRAGLAQLTGSEFDDDLAFKAALQEALGAQVVRDHGPAIIQAAIDINPKFVLVGILGFVASFAMSLGPVMWTLFSEIFPNRNRGLAMAFVGSINSLSSFVVQFVFPWELSNLGASLTFFIYALLGIFSFVLVIKFLPETKGRSLEELEHILSQSKAA